VVLSFVLTTGLLTFVQLKVAPPMLLLERFFPTFGWLEIFGLALYVGFIAEKMDDPNQSAKWRVRIWTLFSVVFFGQLLIGLLGVDKFLMTGKLHLPIPAMIVAGPLYRAERFFMPILFVSTLILVGPAWCSYLCYIGAWDNLAALHRKLPQKMPHWRHAARVAILVLVVAIAILLRFAGASSMLATILGAGFGIAGVGVLILASRKMGVMTHCTTICPIGILANLIGKLSPFRIRIGTGCTECRACQLVCRYDALRIEDIRKRKPGLTCTLCGDCVQSCHDGWIQYRFFKLKPETARRLFLVLIISLFAVFLGVARI